MFVDLVVSKYGRCSADELLGHLRIAEEPETARIDLSQSVWCEPAGLVGIAAFADAQIQLGRSVEVVAPMDTQRANLMARMRLPQMLAAMGCTHNFKGVAENPVQLLELARFDGENGAEDLAAHVYEETAGDPQLAGALHKALSEIGINVPQHSGRSYGYMAAISTHSGRRVEFAVADSGAGLTENLRQVGSADDVESLKMAMDDGVSSTGEAGRGNGVADTIKIVTSLRGYVQMMTGTAMRAAQGHLPRTTTGALAFPGTMLQGALWCP